MAYLFNVDAGALFPLAPHHTFGRLASAVDTPIDRPYISKLHAAIEWNGYNWRVKNLGLNGTWLNGAALGQGDTMELAVGDEIHFVEMNDPGFKVIDLTPPTDLLWPVDATAAENVQPVYLSRYHLLPDAQAPQLAIYFGDEEQQWFMENINGQVEQERIAIKHGDYVNFNNQRWKFIRAQVYGPTEARVHQIKKLTDFEFIFNLSLDEETTQLELHYLKQSIDLASRSHHYLILQLARHRINDAVRGLDNKSQGWVYADQLAHELGLDTTHMNIQIFRARKQLADGLPDALGQQCLLERRGGKIRFGCEKFKIYKGDTLIAASPVNPPPTE